MRLSEVTAARAALGVVALHIADDNFVQPNPGMSASDHLGGGLALLLPLAAAIAFYPRLRAGLRATALFFAGFLGVLATTEAVYYTREVGPSGDDYTGLMSIPAALLLVGLGFGVLWRSRRSDGARWWQYSRRVLIAAGAAAFSATVLVYVAYAYVITHAARASVPMANLGAAYEKVEFTTSDGLRLKGWYVPSRNGAAVISFPGRASAQGRAKMLARHGYGVLVFDRRGEGESEGDPNLLGWQGERDIHAAVRFLQHRADVDPKRIGGIGLSVGGEMMIEASAESRGLKAVVIEGASGRSHRDTIANGDPWNEVAAAWVFSTAASVFSSDVPPPALKSLVPRMSAAAFFIYGERGQKAEKPANEAFYTAALGVKEIWEVPGSGHMAGLDAQPREYERRVVGFFDRTLLRE